MLLNTEHSTALKIGFYNDPSYNLDKYKEYFDIIIGNDGNFTVLDILLQWLKGENADFESAPGLAPLGEFLD